MCQFARGNSCSKFYENIRMIERKLEVKKKKNIYSSSIVWENYYQLLRYIDRGGR